MMQFRLKMITVFFCLLLIIDMYGQNRDSLLWYGDKAEKLYSEKKYKEAIDYYSKAKNFTLNFESKDKIESYINECYFNYACQLFISHQLDEAYKMFSLARTLSSISDNRSLELMALKSMADVSWEMGRYEKAASLYTEMTVLASSMNSVELECEAYMRLRRISQMLGDIELATISAVKADSLLYSGKSNEFKMDRLMTLGTEAMQKGNVKVAEAYFLQMKLFLSQLEASNKSIRGWQYAVYGALGQLYALSGQYEDAHVYCRQCIQMSLEDYGMSALTGMLYIPESELFVKEKKLDDALSVLEEFRVCLEKDSNTQSFHWASLHMSIGTAYLAFGEYKKAIDELRNSMSYVRNTRTDAEWKMFHQIVPKITEAFLKAGETERACKLLENELSYTSSSFGAKSIPHVDVMYNLAYAYSQKGDITSATDIYIQGLQYLFDILETQMKYVPNSERAAFWTSFAFKLWSLSAFAFKTGHTCDAFTRSSYNGLLASKAMLLKCDESLGELINKKGTPEVRVIYRQIQECTARIKQLYNDFDGKRNEIMALDEIISRLDKQLAPQITELKYTDFLNIRYEEVVDALSPNEVLVDYNDFISEDGTHRYVAYILKHGEKYPLLIPVFEQSAIDSLLSVYPLSELYGEEYSSFMLGTLWKPIEQYVPSGSTVYYVPSGLIHQIALESLPLGDGTLLGRHFDFIRLSSAREKLSYQPVITVSNQTTASLFGGLQYEMDLRPETSDSVERNLNYGSAIENLPYSYKEIVEIERILKRNGVSVTPYCGKDGTKDAFLGLNDNSPNILLLSTHGFYYTPEYAKNVEYLKGYIDAMSLSGLFFSGGGATWNGKTTRDRENDGIMTANDIAKLNLSGTELAVLSACKTGQGVPTVEGIFGLQRAFKQSGVKTIIMSLWDVSDMAAQEFMVHFFTNLSDGNYKGNKHEAFNDARLTMRDKYPNSPLYWAGFVMLD